MTNMKRIHSVTVKRIPDMHYRGEDTIGTFDNEAKSEYAIELDSPCYGYRYEGFTFYNAPVDNYLGEDPADIRKYVEQDYARMKQYQLGEFDYYGVRAEAVYSVDSEKGSPIQKVTSGGLWGIESDAGDYFQEIETEQLSELRDQLSALGFSKRAIATAFKTVERQAA